MSALLVAMIAGVPDGICTSAAQAFVPLIGLLLEVVHSSYGSFSFVASSKIDQIGPQSAQKIYQKYIQIYLDISKINNCARPRAWAGLGPGRRPQIYLDICLVYLLVYFWYIFGVFFGMH